MATTTTTTNISVESYFNKLGEDIRNFFTSIGQSTSFGDFINRSVEATGHFVTDLFNGDKTVETLTNAVTNITVATTTALDQAAATGTSPVAVIANTVANAVDSVTDVIDTLVPEDSVVDKITDAVDILAHGAADTAVAVVSSGSLVGAITAGIDNSVSTITDVVTHFDTSSEAAAITGAINSVVDNITDSVDAIANAVVDAAIGSPVGGIQAGMQVLDSVAGIVTSITDAVVATNDPATLDQQAIAGVHAFGDFVAGIDQLGTDIGAGIADIAEQVNGLIHTAVPADSVIGQISDGVTLVAQDIGIGLSDILDSNSLAEVITSSIDVTTQTIGDLVAHFDPNPNAAGIASTVSTVVDDLTDIADSIYGAVTGANVTGAVQTASEVIGSVVHIGQTISDQIAQSAVAIPTPTLEPIVPTYVI